MTKRFSAGWRRDAPAVSVENDARPFSRAWPGSNALKTGPISPIKRIISFWKGFSMSWLLNVPISRKFTFALSVVCGLCFLGIYTFFTLRGITTRNQEVSAKSLPSVVHLTDARAVINSLRREDLDLLLCRAAACKELHTARRQKAIADFQAAAAAFEPFINSPEEHETFVRLQSAISQYVDMSNRGVALMEAGKAGDALDLISAESSGDLFHAVLNPTGEIIELNVKAGMGNAQGATNASRGATWIEV